MMRSLACVGVVALLALAVAIFIVGFGSGSSSEPSLRNFDAQVHSAIDGLKHLPVQDGGRIKPLASFARERLQEVSGKRSWSRLSPILTVLSWALCPRIWSKKPIIKVEAALASELFAPNTSGRATHISPAQLHRSLNARPAEVMGDSPDRQKSRAWRRQRRRLMRFERLASDVRLFARAGSEDWVSLSNEPGLEAIAAKGVRDELASSLEGLDEARFADAAARLQAIASSRSAGLWPPRWRLTLELFYDRIRPFWVLALLYIAIAVTYIMGYIVGNERLLRWDSIAIMPVAALHIAAIVARAVIARKVMASNTYEYILVMTVIAAIAAIVLNLRSGEPAYGFLGSLLCGVGLAATLLSPVSGKITQLPPVLKSDWMTYHVGAAVLSYGVLYLAFGISVAFLLLSDKRQAALRSRLFASNLALVRLGFFLLALGIITGAIWADRAWGRYWGWDPKESWSLVTWCIYGVFLHLRLCLPAKRHRGVLVVVSIVGFVAVLFTFIGVNYILSGLHSYA